MMPCAVVLLLLMTVGSAHAIETGTARIVHADRSDGTGRYETSVQPDTGGWHLVASSPKPYDLRIHDGDRVQVLRPLAAKGAKGARTTAGRVAIAPLTVRAKTATAPSVSGTRRTLVMLLDYANKANTIRRPEDIAGTAAWVTAFMGAASYGALAMPVDVVGPYVIPATAGGCDYWSLANQGDTVTQAAGVDLNVYGAKVYALPQNSACPWSGLGTVGGFPSRAWINGGLSAGGDGGKYVTLHELGHGLGLYHSHGLNCQPAPICWPGTPREYGDTADVMGGGGSTAHFNAAQKEYLGWLTARRVTTGTFTLTPIETTPDALRLARPDGSSLVVEARSVYANWDRKDGVLVHLDRGRDAVYLLDGTPTTSTWSDPALLPGGVLVDDALRIAVRRSDATGATVEVGNAGTEPPIFPVTVAAVVGVASLTLSWQPGTPVAGTGYVVERSAAMAGPFASIVSTTELSYVNDGLVAGTTYCYRIRATNAVGMSPPSAVVCAVPVSLPPGVVVLVITDTSAPGREMVVRGTLVGPLALTATIDGVPVPSKYITVDRVRKTWTVKLQHLLKGPHVFLATSGAVTASMTIQVPK